MGFGGGKQTQTSSTQLPQFVTDAAKQNLARADYVSKLGNVPYYGIDVAGFTPTQQAGMQNALNAAGAFGLQTPTSAMAGMPQMYTDPSTGFTGYRSGDLYDSALAQLQQRRPAQAEAINSMFINPQTGEQNVFFSPMGSFASPNTSSFVGDMATYGGDSTFDGTRAQAVDFSQQIQNLANAPSWVGLLPAVGTAKRLAELYVNQQAKNRANGYSNTNLGFSNDGNTYTSSWGGTYDASGFSPETRAGLSAVASDPYSAASGSTFGGFWD